MTIDKIRFTLWATAITIWLGILFFVVYANPALQIATL